MHDHRRAHKEVILPCDKTCCMMGGVLDLMTTSFFGLHACGSVVTCVMETRWRYRTRSCWAQLFQG